MSATDRAFTLLDMIVGSSEPRGLSDLVRSSGLTKPTVRRLLVLLSDLGYVRQNDAKQYLPGAKSLDLAARAMTRIDFADEFTDVLAGMRVRVPATLALNVYGDHRLATVATLTSHSGYRVAGRSVSAVGLHATASGKAILAHLPRPDVEVLLTADVLPAYTSTTTTDVEKLRLELREVASRGYAINDEESQRGVRCIAAVVRNYLGHPVAAVSMSVAASQVSVAVLRRESPELIRTADEISAALGGPGHNPGPRPEGARPDSATTGVIAR
ncbi:IclR family transcriptional regulator [Mycolicibacterium sp. 624]|uniref:IclR family transcriptional regulator n=1 Tax=Mycolicibacterium sp. 624 TaxID=3156314 RepID=UPI00339090D1